MSLMPFNHSLSTLNPTFLFEPETTIEGEIVKITVLKSPFFVFGEKLRNLYDFFISRVPSPVFASASHVQPDSAAECWDTPCELPSGSYKGSCSELKVTHLPSTGKCLLTAYCQTSYAAIPPQKNEYEYYPLESLMLGNENGTLTTLNEQEGGYLSPEKANEQLAQNFNTLMNIDRELENPEIDSDKSRDLKRERDQLRKEQEKIIGSLKAGDVITLNQNEQPEVVTEENRESFTGKYYAPAIEPFRNLAKATGGIMGLSPSPKHLPSVVEQLFKHIFQSVESYDLLDVAFILDTTGSMHDDIGQVKMHLVNFLRQLIEKRGGDSDNFRVGLTVFRDSGEDYIARIDVDFTSDLSHIEKMLLRLDVNGGGDRDEAVYDALLLANDQLSWKSNAKHIGLLIGDAPPHRTTRNGIDANDVIKKLQKSGVQYMIYPIITNV